MQLKTKILLFPLKDVSSRGAMLVHDSGSVLCIIHLGNEGKKRVSRKSGGLSPSAVATMIFLSKVFFHKVVPPDQEVESKSLLVSLSQPWCLSHKDPEREGPLQLRSLAALNSP